MLSVMLMLIMYVASVDITKPTSCLTLRPLPLLAPPLSLQAGSWIPDPSTFICCLHALHRDSLSARLAPIRNCLSCCMRNDTLCPKSLCEAAQLLYFWLAPMLATALCCTCTYTQRPVSVRTVVLAFVAVPLKMRTHTLGLICAACVYVHAAPR